MNPCYSCGSLKSNRPFYSKFYMNGKIGYKKSHSMTQHENCSLEKNQVDRLGVTKI